MSDGVNRARLERCDGYVFDVVRPDASGVFVAHYPSRNYSIHFGFSPAFYTTFALSFPGSAVSVVGGRTTLDTDRQDIGISADPLFYTPIATLDDGTSLPKLGDCASGLRLHRYVPLASATSQQILRAKVAFAMRCTQPGTQYSRLAYELTFRGCVVFNARLDVPKAEPPYPSDDGRLARRGVIAESAAHGGEAAGASGVGGAGSGGRGGRLARSGGASTWRARGHAQVVAVAAS